MKKIALINDLSGFGKCSLTAAIPVISVMGIQACPLPTAVLTAQTGFDQYYCDDYTEKMKIFTDYWKEMGVSFDGIYSGYLAGANQIEKVLDFLETFRRENTFFLADPVLGDLGELFKNFDHRLVEEMRQLTTLANTITPNLTELCLLAETDYFQLIKHKEDTDYVEKIYGTAKELLKKAKVEQSIIVTGILTTKNGKERIGNMVVDKKGYYYRDMHYTGKSFSGTGDLFASVVCAAMVKKMTAKQATDKAIYFLQEAIDEATREEIPTVHGVNFEKYLYRLL